MREKLAKHLGADNVIFTGGCTHALNLAILGTAYDGEVVCTENEHNSVLRPLQHLADEKNVRFKIATQAQKGRLTFLDLESHLTKDTKLVIVNHISNVNGDVADIEEIGEKLKELNIPVVVDSDAHRPENINSGREEALRALKKAGFTHVMELHGGLWQQVPIGA